MPDFNYIDAKALAFTDAQAPVSLPNEAALTLRGTQLLLSVNQSAYAPLSSGGATTYSPSGGDDAAALSALIAGGAKAIVLTPGLYRWKSQLGINVDGVHIVGWGQRLVFIQVDDSLGNIGHAIKLNSVLDFSLVGCTATAITVRTANAFIQVLGKNNITATPSQDTQQYVVEDVNFENMFDGITFNDGPSNQGAWGGHFNRAQMRNFAAGGVFIDINSPHGGQHYIGNIKIYGDNNALDAARPYAAVRYRGGADIELFNITAVYLQHGLAIDPPAGQAANVTIATACDWDNMTREAVYATTANGGSILGVELNGGWGFTLASSSLPCVLFSGTTNTQIRGGQYWSNFQAVKLNAVKSALVMGIDASNATSCGIYATGSSTDFRIIANTVGSISGFTPPLGIQVDAGCDHYTITHNILRECTTKITNTPGVAANQRIVQDNILN